RRVANATRATSARSAGTRRKRAFPRPGDVPWARRSTRRSDVVRGARLACPRPRFPVSFAPMPLQPMITATRYMVSAGHYLATEAGHAILQAGGNAIDAGVAAGIALGVLHSDQVQFSGVAPMVIYLAERDEVITIAGLGGWPKATDVQTLYAKGAIPDGVHRTMVPAAPDAWILALERYGTMRFGDVAHAAIRYAREGFTVHPFMANWITMNEARYRQWPQNAAIWLPKGRPPREGELFVQTDLARSIQFMVD